MGSANLVHPVVPEPRSRAVESTKSLKTTIQIPASGNHPPGPEGGLPRRTRPLRLPPERIEQLDAGGLDVGDVASDQGQAEDPLRRSNQTVDQGKESWDV